MEQISNSSMTKKSLKQENWVVSLNEASLDYIARLDLKKPSNEDKLSTQPLT